MEKTNLSLLMTQLNISGNELASVLSVDNSLISKWKNNHRPLSPKTTYIQKLTKYLLDNRPENQLRYIHILKILEQQNPDLNLKNSETLENLFSVWVTQRSKKPQYYPKDEINSQESQSGDHNNPSKVFFGNNGRQTAILTFLEEAKKYNEPQEIVLFTQENISWILNDNDFLEIWIESLKELLLKGHFLKIIYWVDRPIDELGNIFNKYLPLYLLGNIETYYFPKYTELFFKISLYMIKNKIGLFGMEGRNDKERYSKLFCDKGSLNHYQWLCENTLQNCNELMSSCKKNNYAEIKKIINNSFHSTTNSLFISKKPCFFTLPEYLFLEILRSLNLSPKMRQRLNKIFYDTKQLFHEIGSKSTLRYIYSKQALEEAFTQDFYIYEDLSNIIGREIQVPIIFLHKHLQNQLELSKNEDSSTVGLTTEPLNVNLFVRDESFFIAWNLEINDDNLFFCEANLVRSIYSKYNSTWKEIPSIYKNHQFIREKLALSSR